MTSFLISDFIVWTIFFCSVFGCLFSFICLGLLLNSNGMKEIELDIRELEKEVWGNKHVRNRNKETK